MKINSGDPIQHIKIFLIIAALSIAGISVIVSHNLTSDLEKEERYKMAIWAEAMRNLITADNAADLSLVLKVVGSNHSIPVIVLDSNEEILDWRNISLDSDDDTLCVLKEYAVSMKETKSTMRMQLSSQNNDYITICYDDSLILKKLAIYPYIQLIVVILFVSVVIYAILSTKKTEESRIWVGLSKETAHQLGTPVSSLMAWSQILQESYPNDSIILEVNRDINRLELIAERFSKIGSVPDFKDVNLNSLIDNSVDYISRRCSKKIKFVKKIDNHVNSTQICASLLEWVFENVLKNAIDSMGGEGTITISSYVTNKNIIIEFQDTGKGILRRNWKNIFKPGFTTKKRGWGLGLSLAKRIIEDYHNGKIYVKSSILDKGTTITVELPK